MVFEQTRQRVTDSATSRIMGKVSNLNVGALGATALRTIHSFIPGDAHPALQKAGELAEHFASHGENLEQTVQHSVTGVIHHAFVTGMGLAATLLAETGLILAKTTGHFPTGDIGSIIKIDLGLLAVGFPTSLIAGFFLGGQEHYGAAKESFIKARTAAEQIRQIGINSL